MESKAKITALGAWVPPQKLTNHDLEKMVETSDEWIVQRTGIKERRITDEKTFASDMAVLAVKDMLARSGKDLSDLDLIIVATFTGDFLTPSVAALVHGKLDLQPQVGVIDINAACAGFCHGLIAAQAYLTTGICKKVLVIGTECMTKIVDFTDRNTCVLFGDGAAAMLVEYSEDEPGFLATYFASQGQSADKIYCTNLATQMNGEDLPFKRKIWQDGRAVYNYSIKTVPQGVKALCEKAGLSVNDLDWFVPHSANLRMIESICEKINFPIEKVLLSLVDYGNTSAASIPLAIWIAYQQGKLKKGQRLALYGFGGGLNQAGLIINWTLA